MVSIATIILLTTTFATNPELFISAWGMVVIGEIFIAYSDEMFDNPNYIDWKFFIGDSLLAVTEPFISGGLKVGSQTLKIVIEKSILRTNPIVSSVSIKFNIDSLQWSLSKIIFENLFNKPPKQYIHDFIYYDVGLSSLHHVFSNIFDYYLEGD